jgi:hypothetical protein
MVTVIGAMFDTGLRGAMRNEADMPVDAGMQQQFSSPSLGCVPDIGV